MHTKAHLTIHSGPASESAQSFWGYSWAFEGEHPPHESTWRQVVAEIHRQAFQWILKVSANKPLMDWADEAE